MPRPFSVAFAVAALALAASACTAAPPVAKAPPPPEPTGFCPTLKRVLATAPTFMGVADGKEQLLHQVAYSHGLRIAERAEYGSSAVAPDNAIDCRVFMVYTLDDNGVYQYGEWSCIIVTPDETTSGCPVYDGLTQFDKIYAETKACLGDAWHVTKRIEEYPNADGVTKRAFAGPLSSPSMQGVRLGLSFSSDACRTDIVMSYTSDR